MYVPYHMLSISKPSYFHMSLLILDLYNPSYCYIHVTPPTPKSISITHTTHPHTHPHTHSHTCVYYSY